MKKQTKQRGFTLIELMIVVAIIGILAAIAIPAFLDYMNKGKGTEAKLQLDNMEKKIQAFHVARSQLPRDATALTPAGGNACSVAGGKVLKVPASTWSAVAGWADMEFHIDQDTLFQYSWDQIGATTNGLGRATGDLDCDGTLTTSDLVVTIVEGNVQSDQTELTPD